MWSGLTPGVAAIWDARLDPDLAPDRERKREDVRGVVLHTTGYGPGLARLDRRHGDDLPKIDEAYGNRMASILDYKGHYLVGRTGQVYQFAPLKYATHHTSSGRRARLRAKHPEVFDLPVWAPFPSGKRSVNRRSVGIDLLAPKPGDGFTVAQYDACGYLVALVCNELDIPCDRYHVTDHKAVHPIDRPGWDLRDHVWDWRAFWAAVDGALPGSAPWA